MFLGRLDRPIQKSPSGVCVSPYWSLARREYPGIEGVPPSSEGKMPSIPALPARSSPPVPTFEEPWTVGHPVS